MTRSWPTVRKTVAVAIVLLGVGLGSTACRQQAETPSQPTETGSAASSEDSDAAMPPELRDVQTTLDAIDSEVASDEPG